MKRTGNTLFGLLLLTAILAAQVTRAEVSASLDRNRVAMGDTLRLTIAGTDGEDVADVDLDALQGDFEILQRSTSSNTSWINGKTSHTKQLVIDIVPLRKGSLQIPPLRVEGQTTNRLDVVVAAAPDINTGGQNVIFEAKVDRSSVYVQGQVILTLHLMQAINLDGRSVSELELDNAFVKALEQKSFQRNIDGRPWLVHEIRYAIFPEQSGTLKIPEQVFTGRVQQQRRGFGFGSRGPLLRRSTKPISIEVNPRPSSFTGSDWLPARQISLDENWSTPPEQLRAGESATRSIRIVGEGLQGAQLPPVLFPPVEGLKFYPDQPEISENEVATGLLGTRQDSAALVPTRAGTWSIPEIRIPWWDTEAEQIRYAILPGRTLTVAPADPIVDSGLVAAPTIDIGAAATQTTPVSADNVLPWKIVSAVSLAGWILTLAYLWRNRSKSAIASAPGETNATEKQAFKDCISACNDGDAPAARLAVINWSSALVGQASMVSLDQVIAYFQDDALRQALRTLDASLYSTSQNSWAANELADCLRRLRTQHRDDRSKKDDRPLALYPGAN